MAIMNATSITKLREEHSRAHRAFHAQRLEAAAYLNLLKRMHDALTGKADRAEVLAEYDKLMRGSS